MAQTLAWRQNSRWSLAVAGAGFTVFAVLIVLREAGTDEGSVVHATVTGVVAVVGGVLLSWLVLWAVRVRMWSPELTPSNEVMGFIYATIGVVYSVILA